MGTDRSDASLERPRHEVAVAPFWLMATEVTNAEYARFLRASAAGPGSDEANLPMVGITAGEAEAYCDWAYPHGGRLPTEAEWEIAARGVAGRQFPWGDAWRDGAANYSSGGSGRLEPVGARPGGTTPEGLADLAGNAYEWTSSTLEPYGASPIDAALRGRRVVRGGSFATARGDASGDAVELRSWYRNYAAAATRTGEIGARCAWSPGSR